jgi:hypothetical protein
MSRLVNKSIITNVPFDFRFRRARQKFGGLFYWSSSRRSGDRLLQATAAVEAAAANGLRCDQAEAASLSTEASLSPTEIRHLNQSSSRFHTSHTPYPARTQMIGIAGWRNRLFAAGPPAITK